MVVAQRSQAVGAVAARVFDVADPLQRLGHDRDHDRQHLRAREARSRQVRAQPTAQAWQRPAEGGQALELAVAAHLRPVRVVAVLLALAGIAAGRLQVAIGQQADPYVGVGRGNGQAADALHDPGIAHGAPVRIPIGEALAGTKATDPRRLVAHVDQPGVAGNGGGRGGRVGSTGHGGMFGGTTARTRQRRIQAR